MTHDRITYLIARLAKADNSPAGMAARNSAIAELKAWQDRLRIFINHNPESTVAAQCRMAIARLQEVTS